MIGRNRGNNTSTRGSSSSSRSANTSTRGSSSSSRSANTSTRGSSSSRSANTNTSSRSMNTTTRGNNNVGSRNANARGNSNSGMGLGGIVKSAVAATVASQVLGNVMDNNDMIGGAIQQDGRGRNSPVRDIKEIRDRTGASLSEAKGAYDRNNQNLEAAIRELMGQGHHDANSQQIVTIGCPSCRTQNPEHVKFCSNCGGGLEVDTPATQPQQAESSGPLTCAGCKANLTGVTGNVCPYCRTAFR